MAAPALPSSSRIAGIGLGLRKAYAPELLETQRRVDWLEVTPENWVFYGGAPRRTLEACIERWPMVAHGVSLDIGGPSPLDGVYLDAVARLNRKLDAPWWSDHVCYSSLNGAPLHDLLPLPFNAEAIDQVARRAKEICARVPGRLLLENATFYAHMPGSTMDEASFLCGVVEAAGCGLLLDVNNVYVNAQNHGFDARAFIDRMPLGAVEQLHLAGHTRVGDTIIDTHIGPIIDPVWDLYRYTLAKAGRMIPTLIEWDAEIPPLDQVLDEVDRARVQAASAMAGATVADAGVADVKVSGGAR